MPTEVSCNTDPACARSWGSEPVLRRLIWEFDEELRFRWVMGGLARDYGPGYSDPEAGAGARGAGGFEGLVAQWLEVAAESGMPLDPRLWTRNPLSSTYPACQAVKAAGEQGPEAATGYLRRLREGLMCERKKLDHADALVGEAGAAGLDVGRFSIDLRSHAITEAFGADLTETRDVPEQARAEGAVAQTEAGERVRLPSMRFDGDGGRHWVFGPQPYDRYRRAAIAAGARVVNERPAEPLEAIERFGRLATREIEELSARPRPIVEAELWALAGEWRLKPISVLTGTLWERA
jgi:putative protein-disulfide isomerase